METISTKECKCNLVARIMHDISHGKIVYTCPKNIKIFSGKKKLDKMIVNPNTPCDFHLEKIIDYGHKKNNIICEDKKIIHTKIEYNIKKDLMYKTKFFISHKLYITFQEIEIICKKINYTLFDHTKEKLIDWCKNLIRELSNQENEEQLSENLNHLKVK